MPELLDIIGQDPTVAQLQLHLAGRRPPHAYLFVGPDGVGRRTTAIALAKAKLCHTPVTRPNAGKLDQLPNDTTLTEACGCCETCRTIDAGSCADFQLVYKELAQFHKDPQVRARKMQNLGIDVIRSFLIEPACRSGAGGLGKVFIVLEAELMSIAAQNALLKTLEEPPDGVTIILITSRRDQMLPTTLSRCTTITFSLLPEQFVLNALAQAGIAPTEAAFWARYTYGSIGRAIELAGMEMFHAKQDLLEQLGSLPAAGKAGLSDELSKTCEAIAKSIIEKVKAGPGGELSKQLATRRAAGVMLELIASIYRDAMALACQAAGPLVHSGQTSDIAAIAERFSPAELAEIIEQLSRYEQLLWRNVNPRTVWDNVAITCATAAPLGV